MTFDNLPQSQSLSLNQQTVIPIIRIFRNDNTTQSIIRIITMSNHTVILDTVTQSIIGIPIVQLP